MAPMPVIVALYLAQLAIGTPIPAAAAHFQQSYPQQQKRYPLDQQLLNEMNGSQALEIPQAD
jgi:hypothetical protein